MLNNFESAEKEGWTISTVLPGDVYRIFPPKDKKYPGRHFPSFSRDTLVRDGQVLCVIVPFYYYHEFEKNTYC